MTAMLPKKAPPADESVVLSDEALVERLRGGEPQAGDELTRRYAPALMRYLSRLCGNAAMAEDLHQHVWLSVLDHIDRFDVASGPGGFRAWLFRIATNKATDLWRSRTRQRAATEELRLMAQSKGNAPDSSHHLLATEEAQRLRAAIEELPSAQREVVCMRYYGNLKFVEIAQTLGCPLNTALGRMNKALLKLRKLMDNAAGGGES